MGSPVDLERTAPRGDHARTETEHDRFGLHRPVRAHWRSESEDRSDRKADELTSPADPADTLAPLGEDTTEAYTPRHIRVPKPTLRSLGRSMVHMLAKGYLTFLAVLMTWTLLPALWGWTSQVVMTGSMMPLVAPGDVLVSQKYTFADLRPGQIIIVHDPNRPGHTLSHRYMRIDDDGKIVTKGDANPNEDATHVTQDQVVGIVRLMIPAVGLPKVWLANHSYPPLIIAMSLTFVSLLILASADTKKMRRHKAARFRTE